MVNPKILAPFLVIQIAVINYLNGNIFVSSIAIYAEKMFNCFLFKSSLFVTIQFNLRFILDKSQTKICGSRPNILLSAYFTSQQINYVYTAAVEREIYVIPFSSLSTFKSIAQIKNITLYHSRCYHIYISHFFSSLELHIFSFDLTK